MKKSINWLVSIIKGKTYFIVFLTLIISILSMNGIVYALFFRKLINYATDYSYDNLCKYSSLFVLILIIQSVLLFLYHRLQEKTMVSIEGLIKKHMLNSILYRNFSYISSIHSGEWMNKTTNDVSVITKNAVNLIPNIIGIFVNLISVLFVLAILEVRFFSILALSILFVLLFELFFYKRIKALHKKVQEKDGIIRVFFQECINSLVVLKAYSKEEKTLRDFDVYMDDYQTARLNRNLFSVIMNFFFSTGVNGMLITSGIYCSYRIIRGEMTYGDFVAIIQIVSQLRTPLTSAYGNIPDYYAMIGSIERLREVDDYSLDHPETNIDFHTFYDHDFESINIENLSFEYEDSKSRRQIISDLNIDIEKGVLTSISGPSGCGKSTLFKLLLSLYKPINGKIEICAKEKRYSLDSSFRSLFAYVPQDNQLMKGTIRDVICFGNEYKKTKMDYALMISCCDEFVAKLSKGVDTELMEKGSGLSEGQMQRIAIARAVYSERPILLLDEATSALNETLELKILNNLKKMTNKTIIMITHHKKTLDYSDKIIECKELDRGYKWIIK